MKSIIKYIVIIVVISIIIAPIIIAQYYGVRPTITEFWLQYTTLLLSTTSFLAVIYTIVQQNKSNKQHDLEIAKEFEFAEQNYTAQILNIVEKFRTKEMIRCRQSSNLLFADLSDEQARQLLSTILKCEACGYLNVENEIKAVTNTKIYELYCDFLQVTNLFYILSCYEYNKVARRAIKQEYDYYRRIFVAVNRLYWETIQQISSDQIYDGAGGKSNPWLLILERFDTILDVDRPDNLKYNRNQYNYELFIQN